MRLDLLIEEQYKSAVAVVINGDGVLLGVSTASDDRNGLLCFPAGGIEEGETPEQAAQRECIEETGYIVEPTNQAFAMSGKPGVAYVPCRLVGGAPKPNHEFSSLGWIPPKSAILRSDIYPSNIDILRKV